MRSARAVAFLGLLALASGCVSIKMYRAPVASFREGVHTSVKAVSPLFQEMNALEVRTRLYGAAATHQPWDSIQHLKPVFPAEEIAVRLSAMEVIARHAMLLDGLVNAQSAEELAESVENFKKSAVALSARLPTLMGPDSQPSALRSLSEPLTTIATAITTELIQARQLHALEKAILEGEKPIQRLISLLEHDLDSVVANKQGALAQSHADLLRVYNERRKERISPEELEWMVESLLRLQAQREQVQRIQAAALLQDMRTAHAALVKYTRSDKKPENLGELAAQLDTFNEHARSVVEGYVAIRSF